MARYLVQHGKSLPKDADPEKGRSEDGIAEVREIAAVGHLPFLQRLASYLITGATDILIFKFQNAGIVCLDKDNGTSNWHIKWTLMPNIR
jgi:phosphohistidine phosphatase SixA